MRITAKNKYGYCVIRRNPEGEQWLDTQTFRFRLEDSERCAQSFIRYAPRWALENPVIATVAVQIKITTRDVEAAE